MYLINSIRLTGILVLFYSFHSCTSNFEEEALFDTQNRISPSIDGTLPLFPKVKERMSSFNSLNLQEIRPFTFGSLAESLNFDFGLVRFTKKNTILDKRQYKELYDKVTGIQDHLLKSNPDLKHLEDSKWEILIVDNSERNNPYAIGPSRAVIEKEMLKEKSKDELASIIASLMILSSEKGIQKTIKVYGSLIVATPFLPSPALAYQPISVAPLATLALTDQRLRQESLAKKMDLKTREILNKAGYATHDFDNTSIGKTSASKLELEGTAV